jgi:hypothetical protein
VDDQFGTHRLTCGFVCGIGWICALSGVVGSGVGAYVRTVKTASGARAVQIVHGSRRGSRTIEHVGSAHDDEEWEALKAAARQRLAGGQAEPTLVWTRRRASQSARGRCRSCRPGWGTCGTG